MSNPRERYFASWTGRLTDRRRHYVPPGTGTLGMWLFLAALAMLFGATLVGYLTLRIQGMGPAIGTMNLPWSLWGSTAVILLSSFTMHRALQNVRAERQVRFQNSLLLTLFLAIGFLLVQAPALVELLSVHGGDPDQIAALYAFVFFLIAIHALHVLGGLIPLFVVTIRAQLGRYDHEFHAPIKYMAMYWHFLDGVWVVLFFVLLIGS